MQQAVLPYKEADLHVEVAVLLSYIWLYMLMKLLLQMTITMAFILLEKYNYNSSILDQN